MSLNVLSSDIDPLPYEYNCSYSDFLTYTHSLFMYYATVPQLNRSRIVKLMNLARQSPVWIQRGTFARWKLQTIILRARCRYLEAPVISASAPQANSNNAAGSGSSSPNKRSSRSTRGGEERVVFPSFDVFELREVQRLSGGQWVYPVALLSKCLVLLNLIVLEFKYFLHASFHCPNVVHS